MAYFDRDAWDHEQREREQREREQREREQREREQRELRERELRERELRELRERELRDHNLRDHNLRDHSLRDRDPRGGWGVQVPGGRDPRGEADHRGFPEPPHIRDRRFFGSWFLDGEGIEHRVVQTDIPRYLGNDAVVKRGTHEGRPGYFYTAYRPLTSAMEQSLRNDSQRYLAERAEGSWGYDSEYHQSQTFKSKQVHLMQIQQQQAPPPKQVQQPQQPPQKPVPPNDPPSGPPPQQHPVGYPPQFYPDFPGRGTRAFITGGPAPDYVADPINPGGYEQGAPPPGQDVPRFPGREHPPPPPPPYDAVRPPPPGTVPPTQVPGVYDPRSQPNQGDDPAGDRPPWPSYPNYPEQGQFGGGRGYGTEGGRP